MDAQAQSRESALVWLADPTPHASQLWVFWLPGNRFCCRRPLQSPTACFGVPTAWGSLLTQCPLAAVSTPWPCHVLQMHLPSWLSWHLLCPGSQLSTAQHPLTVLPHLSRVPKAANCTIPAQTLTAPLAPATHLAPAVAWSPAQSGV